MSVENSFTDLVFSLSDKDFIVLQEVKLILPDHAKCSSAKHDWDLLELFALFDDD